MLAMHVEQYVKRLPGSSTATTGSATSSPTSLTSSYSIGRSSWAVAGVAFGTATRCARARSPSMSAHHGSCPLLTLHVCSIWARRHLYARHAARQRRRPNGPRPEQHPCRHRRPRRPLRRCPRPLARGARHLQFFASALWVDARAAVSAARRRRRCCLAAQPAHTWHPRLTPPRLLPGRRRWRRTRRRRCAPSSPLLGRL